MMARSSPSKQGYATSTIPSLSTSSADLNPILEVGLLTSLHICLFLETHCILIAFDSKILWECQDKCRQETKVPNICLPSVFTFDSCMVDSSFIDFCRLESELLYATSMVSSE